MTWLVDDRYPHRRTIAGHDLDSLCLALVDGGVQVAGPIGGHRVMDAARLRIEAARLTYAADLLDAQPRPESDTPTLFDTLDEGAA